MARFSLLVLALCACAQLSAAQMADGNCTTYCMDILNSKCTDVFGGSEVRSANCLAWCSQYNTPALLGSTTNTSSDTIGCRQYHLSVANGSTDADADLHCPHAGPTGGDFCGSYRDVYCGQGLRVCNSEFGYADTAACVAAFDAAAFPSTSTVPRSSVVMEGDTIQCRLYHLSLASYSGTAATTHCPHAKEEPTAFCVDPTTTAPTTAAATTAAATTAAGGSGATTAAAGATTAAAGATTAAAGATTAAAGGSGATTAAAGATTAASGGSDATTAAGGGGSGATTAAAPDTTPTPTTVSLTGTLTLVGMTADDFTEEAETFFINTLASALGVEASRCSVEIVERRRMLLQDDGLELEYTVTGYADDAAKNAAMTMVQEKSGEILTTLKENDLFADLESISVSGGIDDAAPASAVMSWTVLFAGVTVAFAQYI